MTDTEIKKTPREILLAAYACPGFAQPLEERTAAVAQAGFTAVALDFEDGLTEEA